jgi:hypothetical protein
MLRLHRRQQQDLYKLHPKNAFVPKETPRRLSSICFMENYLAMQLVRDADYVESLCSLLAVICDVKTKQEVELANESGETIPFTEVESPFNPDYHGACVLNYDKLKDIFRSQLISTADNVVELTVDSLKEVEKQVEFIK